MARSDDDGRTFDGITPMPAGFVYSTAINTSLLAYLPQQQRLFGIARYRAGMPS
jgi:hypothetical protein